MGCRLLSRPRLIRLLCCVTVGSIGLSTKVEASPSNSQVSEIGGQVRTEIRIIASVRPTIRVRQMSKANAPSHTDANYLFCVWSNSPTGVYDVGFEYWNDQGDGPDRATKLAWGIGEGVVTAHGRLWVRDQIAAADHPNCSTERSVLTTMTAIHGKKNGSQLTGVVTVLIAPQ